MSCENEAMWKSQDINCALFDCLVKRTCKSSLSASINVKQLCHSKKRTSTAQTNYSFSSTSCSYKEIKIICIASRCITYYKLISRSTNFMLTM